MSLGSRLQQLRESRGWSRAEAARQLGLKYTTYVGYENDERDPGHIFLIHASSFYGVSVDYLLDINNVPKAMYDSVNKNFVFSFNDDEKTYSHIDISTDERKLLYLWREASYEGQQAALAVLSTCVGFKKQIDPNASEGVG